MAPASGILQVLPDWTMGSNPHLGIIGPHAVELVEILATRFLAQYPTIALGDLAGDTSSMPVVTLSQADLTGGEFLPEGYWAFDRYFRAFGVDPQPIIDAYRRGRPAESTAKRIALKPDPSVAFHDRPEIIRHLHEYAKERNYQEPIFKVRNIRTNYIQLINEEALYSQPWTAIATVRDETDIGVYMGDGYTPVIASDVMDKEARFLSEEMWDSGKYQNREAVNQLARMDVMDRIWELASKYTVFSEEIAEPFPLRSILEAIVEQVTASSETEEGRGRSFDHPLASLLAELSGPTPIPVLYANPGVTLVDTADVNYLKLSFFLTNAFVTTAAPARSHLTKFTVIHADSLIRFHKNVAARVCEGIEIILRQGRKFSSNLIFVASDPAILEHERIRDLWGLIGNRMIDASVALDPFALGLVDEVQAGQPSPGPLIPPTLGAPGSYHWMDSSRMTPLLIDPRPVLAPLRHTRAGIPWS